MPKKLSPHSILTLLKKAKKAYQHVKPESEDERETRHLKIEEDLKVLRKFAKKEELGENLEGRFEARKNLLVKHLKVHYQKLKKDKPSDPNKVYLARYLVALGKLTLAVRRLSFNTLDDSEENIEPDQLEDEDLSELDHEEPEQEGENQQAQKKPFTPPPLLSQWDGPNKRFHELAGPIKSLASGEHAGVIRSLLLTFQGHKKTNHLDLATKALDDLEAVLKEDFRKANERYVQYGTFWDSARQQIETQLGLAEKNLLEFCENNNKDPKAEWLYDLDQLRQQVQKLHSVLDRLDRRLTDKLNEAAQTADFREHETRVQEARTILSQYRQIAQTDPILVAMSTSQIAQSDLGKTILNILDTIESKL